MDAFSKELAGILCSDAQVLRVLANKVVPKIVETIAARTSGAKQSSLADGYGDLLFAMSTWAAGHLSDAFENGFISDGECFLYDQVMQNNPEYLEMLQDSFPSDEAEKKFMAMYEGWKKK
jgi:hypothetical protein